MSIARLLILTFMCSAAGRCASPNLLTNGSFEIGEDPEVSTQLDRKSASLSGWSIPLGNIDYVGKRWMAFEGRRCIDLNGVTQGAIAQRIRGLSVGQRYQLSFAMAVNPEAAPLTTRLFISIGGVSNWFSMVKAGIRSDLGWRIHFMEFFAREPTTTLKVISLNESWAGPILDDFRLISLNSIASTRTSILSADLDRDFSTNANPNGPWRYGWKSDVDGPLMLLTTAKWSTDGTGSKVFSWQLNDWEWPATLVATETETPKTPSDWFPGSARSVYVAPGMSDAPERYGAVRFTVPAGGSGDYRIQAAVQHGFNDTLHGDADFHVATNGVEVFGLLLAPHVTAGYTNEVFLVDGDVIDFVVGRGWDQKHPGSQTKLSVRIDTL